MRSGCHRKSRKGHCMRVSERWNPAVLSSEHRLMPVAALLIAFACVHSANAQRITAAGGVRITGSAPSPRVGAIATGPGGERAGNGLFATSESTARIVSGKVKGYGEKTTFGALGEVAPPGGAALFASHGDFPDSDFVATMPRPNYAAPSPGAGSYGLRSFSGNVSGSRAFSSGGSGGHYGGASIPTSHIKTSESILSPFTHPIGGNFGTMPSTGLGAARP